MFKYGIHHPSNIVVRSIRSYSSANYFLRNIIRFNREIHLLIDLKTFSEYISRLTARSCTDTVTFLVVLWRRPPSSYALYAGPDNFRIKYPWPSLRRPVTKTTWNPAFQTEGVTPQLYNSGCDGREK